MRRCFLLLSAFSVLGLTSAGGLIDAHYVDPAVERDQRLIDAENQRELHEEWRPRFWLQDQPMQPTPYRIHGGVGPASSSI